MSAPPDTKRHRRLPAANADAETPKLRGGARPSVAEVAAALRARTCPPERAFDCWLPPALRVLSRRYWTPLPVVLRATEWLEELGVRSVVDIGSGAGKFCVAGALAGQCRYLGLEQRPGLLSAARQLARTFGVEDRAEFVEGVFGAQAPPPADAYYVYNPFEENLAPLEQRIPEYLRLSGERYVAEVAAMEDFLAGAPPGTYLLTYNGFGGRTPADYRQLRSDRDLPSPLHLWRKTVGPTWRPRRRASAGTTRVAA